MSASAAAPPVCRLDQTLPPRVRAAAEVAWAAAIAGHDDQPKTIAFNPIDETSAFPIYFVRDGLAGGNACDTGSPGIGDGSPRSFDQHTIRGICRYNRSASVECSSDAIRELLDIEKRYRDSTSPSLVYVFAHEFGHRLGGDQGEFTEGVVSVNLGGDRKANLAELRRLCDSDPEQIKAEENADRFAFDVARRVFAATPFRRGRATALQSVVANADVVYKVSEVLNQWTQYYYGRPTTNPFLKTKEICRLIDAPTGEIILPQYRGSHPQGWTRLATIDAQLDEYTQKLAVSDAGVAKELDLATIDINRLLEDVQSRGYTQFAAEFCNRVSRIENGSINCSAPPDEPDDLPVTIELPDGGSEKARVKLLDDPSHRPPSEPAAPPSARPSKPFKSSLMLEGETFEQFLSRAEEVARRLRERKTGKPQAPLDPNVPAGSTLTPEETNGVLMYFLSEAARAAHDDARAAQDEAARKAAAKPAPPPLSTLRTIEGETLEQFLHRAEEAARRIREYQTGKPEPPLDPNAEAGSTLTVAELTELSTSMLADLMRETEAKASAKEPATLSELSRLHPTQGESFEQFLHRAEEVARRLRKQKTGTAGPPLDPNAPPGSTLTVEEMNELTEGLLSERRPPDKASTPLQFQPSGTYRDVDGEVDALILEMHAVTFDEESDEAHAQGRQMSQAFAAFFKALDERLHKDGGYWVHYDVGPVEVGYDGIMVAAFFADLKVRAIARSPSGFDPKSVPEFAPLRRWVRDDDVWRKPWNQAAFPARIEFRRKAGVREGEHRIITKPLTLDKIYDLDAASNGRRDRPSPFLRDLTSFVHERLMTKFGGTFILDNGPGDAPFELTLGEHMDLPRDWVSSVELTAQWTIPNAELSAAIDQAFDEANHAEPVSTIYPP